MESHFVLLFLNYTFEMKSHCELWFFNYGIQR